MPPNVYPSGISNDAVWYPFIEPRIMCAPCGRFQGKNENLSRSTGPGVIV